MLSKLNNHDPSRYHIAHVVYAIGHALRLRTARVEGLEGTYPSVEWMSAIAACGIGPRLGALSQTVLRGYGSLRLAWCAVNVGVVSMGCALPMTS